MKPVRLLKNVAAAMAMALLTLAMACTITVDPGDTSPPTLSVVLNAANNLNAHYMDTGESLEGNIDPDRVFRVEPRTDAQNVQLIFIGSDGQSGISRLDGETRVDFTCHTGVLGGQLVSDEKSAWFSNSYFERTPPGEETSSSHIEVVQFSYEDLWQRGNCSTWGQIINVDSGRITDIRAEYSGIAFNNSVPASPGTRISGRFEVAGGPVDIAN